MELEAHDIHVDFDGKEVLSGANLTLRKPGVVALCGDNGSGKTTLSLVLAGIIKPEKGTVRLDGLNPFDDSTKYKYRRHIGYVFQNPEDGFVATDVRREIAFTLENLALPRDEIIARVNRAMETFGLMPFADRSPLELSGGMKARVAIATAIASGADFLILDEPEAYLDYNGIKSLFSAISETRNTAGILHITQLPKAAQNADKVLIIKDGKLTEPKNIPLCAPELPKIEAGQKSDEIALAFENVDFSYAEDLVLTDISLVIRKGELVGLVGASGSGKTTLALLAAGILKPSSGRIESFGRVGIVMQFPEMQLFANTVWNDVCYGPKVLGLNNPQKKAADALELVGIDEELWNLSPFELSDGQQRLVGLAGVIATNPEILILDEPFAALDPKTCGKVLKIIAALTKKETTIILITHRTDILSKTAHRVVALKAGRIAYSGNANELFGSIELCEKLGIAPPSFWSNNNQDNVIQK